MFEIFTTIKKSVKQLDEITSKSKNMSNPFNKKSNNTIVWTEKKQIFDRYIK